MTKGDMRYNQFDLQESRVTRKTKVNSRLYRGERSVPFFYMVDCWSEKEEETVVLEDVIMAVAGDKISMGLHFLMCLLKVPCVGWKHVASFPNEGRKVY